jgi:Short chain fatty acid transporter
MGIAKKNIFTFAFQMVLVLVTGYTLAEAPILKRAIIRIASKPTNQGQGALLCFGVSAVFSLLNWGLGLVAGALVARQVAKRIGGAHFGYLIAAGFMGFIIWTQGLSSSIALANTEPTSPINVIHKMTGTIVQLRLTIFQPYSWIAVCAVVVLLAVAIWSMEPKESLEPDPAVFDEEPVPAPPTGNRTFAEWLENLWILNVVVFAAGITYFVLSGFALNISSMIMLFTVTSALLHRTPIRFIRAFSGAAKVSGPLLLQYPLYGGIIGLLGYLPAGSGKPLQTLLAEGLVRGADEYTLPFLTFIGSVIISLFVPSGGALGCTGADRGRLGAGHWPTLAGLPRADLNGGRRRRGGREYDSTVLAAAGARHREAQCAPGHWVYDHRLPDRFRGIQRCRPHCAPRALNDCRRASLAHRARSSRISENRRSRPARSLDYAARAGGRGRRRQRG